MNFFRRNFRILRKLCRHFTKRCLFRRTFDGIHYFAGNAVNPRYWWKSVYFTDKFSKFGRFCKHWTETRSGRLVACKEKNTTTPLQVVHVPNKQPRLIKPSTQLTDADTTCLERVSTALLLPPAGRGCVLTLYTQIYEGYIPAVSTPIEARNNSLHLAHRS